MEKYCPKCHKTYADLKAKFCTNCATELITREKRKPIPRELRHEILVRDGYRCRECGKSKDETSLEIDHIYPLSKGGTTSEDNLWTLCRDCNQDKRDDIWKDDEIEITRNELANLENQLRDAEEGLKNAKNEDDIREYKFKIKKFNTEYIPDVKNKLNKLTQDEKVIEAERKKQKEENKRRENLFKDLYIELEGELLIEVLHHFSLNESSNEDNLRLLVDKYSEQEIFNSIANIKKELDEKNKRKLLKESLNKKLSNEDITLIANEFNINNSKSAVIDYLVDNYNNENEILSLTKELNEKNKRKLLKESLNKKLNDGDIKLIANEFNINNSKSAVIDYLVDNYNNENEILSLTKELNEKNKRKLLKESLNKKLNDGDIKLIANEFNINNSKSTVIDYLVDNYNNENEILSLTNKLNEENTRKINLTENLFLYFNDKEIFLFSDYFKLPFDNKKDVLSYLVEKHTEDEISSLHTQWIGHKKEIYGRLDMQLSELDILEIANNHGISYSRENVLNYIINNYSDKEITTKKYLNESDDIIF